MKKPVTRDMYAILSVIPTDPLQAADPETLFSRSGLKRKAFDRAFSRLPEETVCRDSLNRCFLSNAGRQAMAEFRRAQENAAIRQLTWRYAGCFFGYAVMALGFALWMLLKALLS